MQLPGPRTKTHSFSFGGREVKRVTVGKLQVVGRKRIASCRPGLVDGSAGPPSGMPSLETFIPLTDEILEVLELIRPKDGPYLLPGSQPKFAVSTVRFVSGRAVENSTLLQDLAQLRALLIIQFNRIRDPLQHPFESTLRIAVSPPLSGMRTVAAEEWSRMDQQVGQSPTENTSDHEDEENPKNGLTPTRQ